MSAIWAKIHGWLALLMAIQILFWFASGLFFSAFPIEQVRSEHAVAGTPPTPVPFGTAADGLLRLGSAGIVGDRIEIRALAGRPVALVSTGEARPRLFDLASAELLSPLPMDVAVRIAEADHDGALRATRVERVAANTTEYRGALPAWRVDFDDGEARSIYVAADSGTVTARRSTLWRVYDFLWGLHIMDWRHHENFNSILLIVTTALGLIVVVSGIVMLPSRLGYTAWRRRRRALKAARSMSPGPLPDEA